MKCEEYRRRLGEDPYRQSTEMRDHAALCPECRKELERALAFERRIRTGMNIDPPPGLEERLKVLAPSRRRHNPLRIAAAAALLMALGIGVWLVEKPLPFGDQPVSAAMVLAHIEAELEYLEKHQALESSQLRPLLGEFGIRLQGDLGTVYHISRCPLGTTEGLHLVVAGRQGPITVLLLPDVSMPKPIPVASHRFTGVLLPSNLGGMAVVGGPGEMVDPLVTRLRQTLRRET